MARRSLNPARGGGHMMYVEGRKRPETNPVPAIHELFFHEVIVVLMSCNSSEKSINGM